jgi:hypothetical protein
MPWYAYECYDWWFLRWWNLERLKGKITRRSHILGVKPMLSTVIFLTKQWNETTSDKGCTTTILQAPCRVSGEYNYRCSIFSKGIASICPSTAGFTAKVCGTSNLAPWGTACGILGGPSGHLTAEFFHKWIPNSWMETISCISWFLLENHNLIWLVVWNMFFQSIGNNT